MGENNFTILLNMKTGNDYENVGRFFIGNNRKTAGDIFRKLKGSTIVDNNSVLSIELVETVNGLPVNLQMLSCSLEDVAENCRTITREVFKLYNLGELE